MLWIQGFGAWKQALWEDRRAGDACLWLSWRGHGAVSRSRGSEGGGFQGVSSKHCSTESRRVFQEVVDRMLVFISINTPKHEELSTDTTAVVRTRNRRSWNDLWRELLSKEITPAIVDSRVRIWHLSCMHHNCLLANGKTGLPESISCYTHRC